MPARPTRSAPRRRRGTAGFTLIELLICVVIIGLLSAFAAPRFANTKGKANLSNVKSDLHNLIAAQESYFNEHQTYATDPSQLDARKSRGVVLTVVSATATGWSARAEHPAAVPVTCAIFYGSAPALAPATIEGAVACQ